MQHFITIVGALSNLFMLLLLTVVPHTVLLNTWRLYKYCWGRKLGRFIYFI